MKRCELSGRAGAESAFEGNCCGWCDKIKADLMVDLQKELGMEIPHQIC